jgi:hypothetical protein
MAEGSLLEDVARRAIMGRATPSTTPTCARSKGTFNWLSHGT